MPVNNSNYEVGRIRHDRGEFIDKGNQLFEVVHPDYGNQGAKGDGTTEDYQAFRDAIDDCVTKGGGIVFAREGTYKISTAISKTGISVPLVLRGAGPGRTTFDFSGAAAGATLITVEGATTVTSTTASVAIAKRDTSITVVATAGFAAGDMVKITSTQAFSETDSTYKKGELAFIKSVTSATVMVLTQGARDAYAVSGQTVTIQKLTAAPDCGMEGFKLLGGGSTNGAQFGIVMRYVNRPWTERVWLRNVEDIGIAFDHAWYGVMDRCSAINTDGGGAVPGYAFSFDTLSTGCLNTSCDAENFRHAFQIGSLYPVWDWTVTDIRVARNVGDFEAISTHQNAVNGQINGGHVHDSYIGVALTGPSTLVNGMRFSCIRYSCVDITADAPLKTKVTNCIGRGCVRGVTSGPYSGTTKPDVTIEGNDFYGEAIAGVAVGQGISCNTPGAKLADNKLRGFSPGIGCGADAVEIDSNDLNDIAAGQPYGVYVHSGAVGVRVRRNRTRDENAIGAMTHGINIESATDTLVEDNDLDGYTTAPIADNATRTRKRRNTFTGPVLQKHAVLGTTAAGATNGTTAGKAKTANTIAYEINGRRFTKAATDDLWTMTGVTTTAGQFRKVLLCLNESGTASIVVGVTAASQTLAKIPDWQGHDVCPVAFVEIPNSYTDGGSLAGYVFQDLLGVVN